MEPPFLQTLGLQAFHKNGRHPGFNLPGWVGYFAPLESTGSISYRSDPAIQTLSFKRAGCYPDLK